MAGEQKGRASVTGVTGPDTRDVTLGSPPLPLEPQLFVYKIECRRGGSQTRCCLGKQWLTRGFSAIPEAGCQGAEGQAAASGPEVSSGRGVPRMWARAASPLPLLPEVPAALVSFSLCYFLEERLIMSLSTR